VFRQIPRVFMRVSDLLEFRSRGVPSSLLAEMNSVPFARLCGFFYFLCFQLRRLIWLFMFYSDIVTWLQVEIFEYIKNRLMTWSKYSMGFLTTVTDNTITNDFVKLIIPRGSWCIFFIGIGVIIQVLLSDRLVG